MRERKVVRGNGGETPADKRGNILRTVEDRSTFFTYTTSYSRDQSVERGKSVSRISSLGKGGIRKSDPGDNLSRTLLRTLSRGARGKQGEWISRRKRRLSKHEEIAEEWRVTFPDRQTNEAVGEIRRSPVKILGGGGKSYRVAPREDCLTGGRPTKRRRLCQGQRWRRGLADDKEVLFGKKDLY